MNEIIVHVLFQPARSLVEGVKKAFVNVDRVFIAVPMLDGDKLDSQVFDTYLNAAKSSGTVKHIVYLSAIGARPDTKVQLKIDATHRRHEQALRESSIPYTSLQPTFFSSNYITWRGSWLRQKGQIIGAANDSRFTVIDIRDIVDVAVELLRSDPNKYNGQHLQLTSDRLYSEDDIAAILSKVLQRPIEYKRYTEEEYTEVLKQAGVTDKIGDLLALDANRREGDMSHVSDAVERITGHKPRTFEQFAEEYPEAFKTGKMHE